MVWLGPVLGTGDAAVNKTDKNLNSPGSGRRQTIIKMRKQ